MNTQPERMLQSIATTARELDLSPARIYQLIDEGKLAAVKIGKSRRIVSASVRAYVATLRDARVVPPGLRRGAAS